MATIQFSMSAKTDKTTGKHEILVRFFHGRINQRAKTNVFVIAEHWNQEKQRNSIPRFRIMTAEANALVAELTEQNARLATIADLINQSFIDAGAGKLAISPTWLVDLLNGYNFPSVEADDETPKSFFDVFAEFVATRPISEHRKAQYRVVGRCLQRFTIYKNIEMTFDELTPEFLRGFNAYLKNEHTFYEVVRDEEGNKAIHYKNPRFAKAIAAVPESTRMPQARGDNAIADILTRLRSFVLWANDNGLTACNPFRKYRIPNSVYGTPYYISIEERNHLYHFDLSARPQLAVHRDIFVFQCVVGCRVSDLRNLTKSSIIDGAVEYIPRKTKGGNPVTTRVPLNSIAAEIVERYKDIPGERLLPCISDQGYNDAIKDMFKLAGLTRLVTILNPTTREEEKRPLNEIASSHLARRCFVGNLYKQVKDPNLVCKLSGHKENSKAFARYRDIDEDMRKDLVRMLE